MSRQFFGTDGIRGKVGQAPITPEFVLRLGHAAGEVLVSHARRSGALKAGQRPAVLIGKDTRISGYMIEAALEAGFAAAGVDVMLTGPLPTPGIAYLTRALRVSAGVVISASHNPYDDNGIKFFSADGFKLPDAVENEIEQGLSRPVGCRPSRELGRARRIDDAAGRYIEFCKSSFPNELDLHGMKIVVDCANGAAYHIAPHVLHELGADVVAIGDKPDGLNINQAVGATHPQALVKAVLRHRADLGIALDGDADRLLMVDGEGRTYDGDQLLWVIVSQAVAQGGSARRRQIKGVAGTLMTNLALEQALRRLGLGFGRAAVGDRYVLELMRKKGWMLGGENSGHIICLDKHSTGDGLVSALQVLAAIRSANASAGRGRGIAAGVGVRRGGEVTLASLSASLKLFPQVLLNVAVPRGFDWKRNPALVRVTEAAQKALGDSGRVLLRPSGTEPVLRVMVEGRNESKVRKWAQSIAQAVT